MDNDRNERVYALLQKLENEGFKISPADIKNPETLSKSLEDRLSMFGPGSTIDDWWVEGGWTMSF